MQNGFQKFNLQHTSASSINTWAKAPDVWVADKLFGIRNPVGAAAHRGNAVEAALINILAYGVEKNEAINQAIEAFNSKTALLGDAKTESERSSIAAFVECGLQALSEYGQPFFEAGGKQSKIELLARGAGWELPVIGFLDLVYPRHGLVIDIKTTHKAPSTMSADHNRQAAIYRKASGNAQVRFLYITPKKTTWHECTDVEGTLSEIKQILNEQEEFLRSVTKEDLAPWAAVNRQLFPTGRNAYSY